MSASSTFVARLGLRCPIIQAPMAGVSTPALAAAVCEAGGLGSLGIGAATVAEAGRMMADTGRLTARPFNVNVFCHAAARRDPAREAAWLSHLAPLYAEVGLAPPAALHEIYRSFVDDDAAFALLLDRRPAVVSFHFGLPQADRLDALRRAGIYTMATATNLAEAERISAAGVDAIVAQGFEAGGHRGVFDPDAEDEQLGTLVLVRLLVERIDRPIVAAGGIMDGRGVRAALDLGAAAAQLGTAFVLCPESAASPGYRAALRQPGAVATRLTRVLSGRPARGLVNRFVLHGESPGAPPPADYPVAYDAAKQLHAAAVEGGQYAFGAHWAGQGAALARELPAARLIETLVEEMAAGADDRRP